MSREIDQIVIHCAATQAKADIGAAEIRRWHKDRGWADIGYHYVIRRNGDIEPGRPEEVAGAHVAGHNRNTIGICMVGGIDEHGNPETNFTTQQFWSLRNLVDKLRQKYGLLEGDVIGHREFPGVHKDCPCFDVHAWYCLNEIKP